MIDLCYNVEVLKIIRYIKIVLEIVTVSVPIILIVVSMLDFLKCSKSGEVSAGLKLIKNKIIAAAIIFLVPTIVTTVVKLVGNFGNDFYACIENSTMENIQILYVNKAKELVDKAVETNNYADYLRAKAYLSNIGDEDLINEYEEQLAIVYEKIKENINSNLGTGESLDVDNGIFLKSFTGTYDSIQYYEVIPYGATTNMPIIVYLHGDGNTVSTTANSPMITATNSIYDGYAPYILIVPYSKYSDWVSYNMPQTVKELVEYVADEYGSDMSKISITGHSRGAIGTWGAVNSFPEFYFKALPVSCGGTINPYNFYHTEVRAYVGTVGDESIYYGQMLSNVNAINNAGGKAKFISMDGYDHGMTPGAAYTQTNIEWLISD